MAALLSRSGADGKPYGNPGLPVNETLTCSVGACSISYVLSYGQVENRMVGNENNLDIMRRKARELITQRHPHPLFDETYVWGRTRKRMVGQGSCESGGIVIRKPVDARFK